VKPRDPLALGRGEERRGGGGLVDLEGNGRREGEEYAPDEGRWGSNECWTDGPRSGVRWWEGSWPFDAEAKQSETLVRVHPGCQPGISVAVIEIEAEEGKKSQYQAVRYYDQLQNALQKCPCVEYIHPNITPGIKISIILYTKYLGRIVNSIPELSPKAQFRL
jgi:hypothetical protein